MSTTTGDPGHPSATTVLRFLAQSTDVGYGGRVDGGRVLEWIDKAGYACAAEWSGRYCVTAFIGDIRFVEPISAGELVEVAAHIVYTGRTSMHILITVSAGDPRAEELVKTTQCLAVFIAVDDAGIPVAVPAWTPQTVLDQRHQLAARRRISVRTEIEAAMAGQDYSDDTAAPHTTLRFLAAPTDVNWGGKVHGGKVMRWIDEAAFVCASKWTSQPVITSRVSGVRFYRPILIGNMIEVDARIIHTGAKRLDISVHVRAIDIRSRQGGLAAHALTTVVALDPEGHSEPVPQWAPVTDEDRRLDQHARDIATLLQRGEVR
ncbi:MAG: acyl-CoA thioesterase [Mycobacterium sp.]